MRPLRVLSLDVDRLRGRRAAVLRVLRETAPDVACLHRVPTHEFSGHRLGTLAADAGLLVAVGGRPTSAAVLTALRVDVPITSSSRHGRGGYALAAVRLLDGATTWVATIDATGDGASRAGLARDLLDEARILATEHSGATSAGGVAAAGTSGAEIPLVVSGPSGPGDPAREVLLGRLTEATPAPAATGALAAAPPTADSLGLLVSGVPITTLPLPGEIGRHPEHLRFVGPHRPVLAELR